MKTGRNSTCSTDNGSLHSHQDTRLTQVASNHSNLPPSPKNQKSTTQVSPSQQTMSTPSASPASSPTSTTVHLDTLLVTGERKSWRFHPNDSIDAVRTHIYHHWPHSWPQPKPASPAYLRILHLGHFLDNPEITLVSRGCKPAATTVVHIVIRSLSPPEPTKLDQATSEKRSTTTHPHPNGTDANDRVEPGCSCVIC